MRPWKFACPSSQDGRGDAIQTQHHERLFDTNDAARVDQGEDISCRSKEQKRYGGPQAGALFVDAGKEGHDGARANGENRACKRSRRIRNESRRPAPQESRDGLFGDEGSHRSGNVESRHQAQQYMRRKIGGQDVALGRIARGRQGQHVAAAASPA